jgi:DnaJ-class molecular chaperone
MKVKRFEYEQMCSRCNGSGEDPVISNCVCDCCDGTGMETLTLTPEEAAHYPNVSRKGGDSGKAE